MGLTRLGREILLAIAVVAVVPMIGAVVLGQIAVGEAYRVGVNPQVKAELQRGLEVDRAHILAMRKSAEVMADRLAFDGELTRHLERNKREESKARLTALIGSYEEVVAAELFDGAGQRMLFVGQSEIDDQRFRQLDLDRNVPLADGGRGRLVVTVVTPNSAFHDFQRAGERMADFVRLERSGNLVSRLYLAVYAGFLLLLSVIVAVMAAGVVLSRLLTRRVALVADARAKVGRGDAHR